VVSVEWCDKNTDVFYRKKMKKGEKSDTGQQIFHLQGERFGVVFCMVDLFGYNGKEVVVSVEWCDKNTDVFYRKKMKKGEKSDTGQQIFH
ncbi:hypothetical protein E7X19_26575, partial [Bacteroides fragilis]